MVFSVDTLVTFAVCMTSANSLKCPQGVMNMKVFPFLASFFPVFAGWLVMYSAEQLS